MQQLLLALLLTVLFPAALANSIDDLLDKVKQQTQQEYQLNTQRETEFLQDKQHQEKKRQASMEQLQVAKTLNATLNTTFKNNQLLLDKMQAELTRNASNLDAVFGVVRQTSSDLTTLFSRSIISAQLPQRIAILNKIEQQTSLPNRQDLEKLWLLLLEQMTQSARIMQFEAPYSKSNGQLATGTITRIGSFVAFNAEGYLKYSTQEQKLVAPAKQPGGKINKQLAKYFSNNNQVGIGTIYIDPSQGDLLDLFISQPTIKDRIKQSGGVGLAIILLGLIGLSIAILRVWQLNSIHRQVQKQLNNIQNIKVTNPLGRILSIYQSNQDESHQALEIKLEEAILKEVPQLDRGINFIKLLAAVAPLMGLLGTVVGMISTFQTIVTLGTSDPSYMAAGISQALLTTILGLIVAIPLLFSHAIVQTAYKKIVVILSQQSAGLLAKKIQYQTGPNPND